MIEFDHVSFEYEKGKPVISDVSLRIEPGESVGLIGANGAGKSTILKLILGLLRPTEGTVRVFGLETVKDNLAAVRKRAGFVLQDPDDQMFMPTVLDDMMFAPLNYGMSREDAEARVSAVLKQLDLEYLRDRYNHRISGGEKRMAAIATILTMEPELILMDEPSSSLDPYNRRKVIDTVKGLPQTKLITSHDLDMILDICSRVILISGGKIAADGPAETVLTDKALLEANRMELPFCLAGRPQAGR